MSTSNCLALAGVALLAALPVESGELPRAIAVVGERSIEAVASEDCRSIVVRSPQRRDSSVRLPAGAGAVTELRAGPWIDDGVALAIESTRRDGKPGKLYFWATLRSGRVAVGRVAALDADHDLGAVLRPEGDTIYFTLTRLVAGGRAVEGFVFIHPCPIAPVAGRLVPLQAPADATGE